MSTLEQIVSMLELMSEEKQILVLNYTQTLLTSRKTSSPFKSLTDNDVLNDLEVSRFQNENGQGVQMKKALLEMGKCHGFV